MAADKGEQDCTALHSRIRLSHDFDSQALLQSSGPTDGHRSGRLATAASACSTLCHRGDLGIMTNCKGYSSTRCTACGQAAPLTICRFVAPRRVCCQSCAHAQFCIEHASAEADCCAMSGCRRKKLLSSPSHCLLGASHIQIVETA